MKPKLVFNFDPNQKQYTWPLKSSIDHFTSETNILHSELSNILEQVNKIDYLAEKTQKLQDKMQYTFTIKLLIIESLLLLAFLILIIYKIYFSRHLSLDLVAIPLACVGLLLNLIIVLKKGKLNFRVFSKEQSSASPDPAFRHKVFMVLNAFNKTNTYGLQWKIVRKGKVLELGCLE